MSSLVDFGERELEWEVNWAEKKQSRFLHFLDDEVQNLMLVSDGASILIRERCHFEISKIKKAATEQPDTHKFSEILLPSSSKRLTLVAAVGMDAGKLQRMLAEMDPESTVNVYLLKHSKHDSHVLAFEQEGQVGLVMGKTECEKYLNLHMRTWEKAEGL